MVLYRLTSVETVREEGSWLFTVIEGGTEQEVFLVPCDAADKPPVEAWFNRCTHENQRLHREGIGAVLRDGEVVCPKHGSTFEACSGGCDNGPAAGSTLRSIDIDVNDGDIYLTDSDVRFRHEGPKEDEDDEPGATSHLRF
jgi:nitrite reductase/ring-hydroxylating ferredoxin subunit